MGRSPALWVLLMLVAAAGLLVAQPAPQDPPKAGEPVKQDDPAKQDPAKQDPPKADPAVEPGKQDPVEPPTPAPPQEDKAPITAAIDTWMRYMQEGEHRGFVHEKISPVVGQLYRYDYLYEGDLDMTRPGEGGAEAETVHWSWQITARLTETFDPLKLEGSGSLHGAQWRWEIRTAEDLRIVEVTLPGTVDQPVGELLRAQFQVDQQIGMSVELLFLKLRQRGDLAKAGKISYPMLGPGATQVGVTLRVEEPVMKTYMGKRAFVTKVSLENMPSDSGTLPVPVHVYVDKFGRIVEAVQSGEGSQYVICATATEAKGGEHKLSARGRRDPFQKLGAMTPVGRGSRDTGAKGKEPPLVIAPERVGEKLAECGKMIDDLEKLVKAGDLGAEKVYQKFLKIFKVLRPMVKGDPVKVNQLDGYKAKAEQVYGGAERLVKRAQMLLEGIEDFYNALNAKGVEENLKQLKELYAKPEFYEDDKKIEMEKIIKTAEHKLAQTMARLELRDKMLVLTGTVSQTNVSMEEVLLHLEIVGGPVEVREQIKVIHNLTFAVVNEKLYRENEEVENQGVVIEKIQPHGIRVSYKGEVREIGLKKQAVR